MSHLLHLLQTLASFALVLGVLVFIHELGHYLAARWRGIYVEAFSIGFGRALLSWTDRRGTVWKISMLPLGGYVRMYGMAMDGEATEPAKLDPARAGQAYYEKSVLSRSIVTAAGPAANFVLAVVLFAGLQGVVGREIPLAVVGPVVSGSAAEAGGLKTGDLIRSIDGRAVVKFDELRAIVAASPARTLSLAVHRGTQDITLHVTPKAEWSGGTAIGKLGVGAGAVASVRVGPIDAILGGFSETWMVLSQIVVGLGHMIATGQGAKNLGGPIGIALVSGQVAQMGMASLIAFVAALSVNLGLVNLLPVPILDGGHLMFYAVEAVRGRPVPARAQEYGYRIGAALLVSLFVFVSFNDLVHVGVFAWVARVIG